MSIVDLHSHTTASDGRTAPAALLGSADARGVTLFAITDHDTVRGAEQALGQESRDNFVMALELSCSDGGATTHLLLYRVERARAWDELECYLRDVATRRRDRVHEICARLARHKVRLDPAKLIADAGGAQLGRMHVARALVATGQVADTREAFSRFLSDGNVADVSFDRLPVEDALGLATAAGCVVSLAHPHRAGRGAAGLVERFAGAGLTGIEAHYGPYKPGQRRRWQQLADSAGLVATAGSDFHGPADAAPAELGVEVDDSTATRMREWLGLQ